MNRLRADASADDVAAALDQDGYAIVENLLPAENAAAIRAELTKILDTTPEGRNAFEGFSTRRVYAIFAKTRAFDKLAMRLPFAGYVDGRHPRRALDVEKETAQ